MGVGRDADDVVLATDFAIWKVDMQIRLVFSLLVAIEKHHLSVGGTKRLDQIAQEVMDDSPYKDHVATGTTLLRYYRDFVQNEGFFSPDLRGTHRRDTLCSAIVENEDWLMKLKTWIKSNLSEITVSKVTSFIQEKIVSELTDEQRSTLKIGPTTNLSSRAIWSIMTHEKVGCRYGNYTKCYYVDAHERPDVRAYREKYLARFLEMEISMYKWIQITKQRADDMRSCCYPTLPGGHGYVDEAGIDMVEFHVDDCVEFDHWRVQEAGPFSDVNIAHANGICMGGNLSVRFPTGKLPIIHLGQDEACFKAFLLPSETWTIDGYQPLRPKAEGPSLMLSGFVGGGFYFGVPMPRSVIESVNEARRAAPSNYSSADSARAVYDKRKKCKAAAEAHGETPVVLADTPEEKPQLPVEVLFVDPQGTEFCLSPGLRTLNVGKAREGYWDSDEFLLQCEDLIDCMGTWFPDHQILAEVDHSSGHDKFKPDGLYCGKLNGGIGGKQRPMRTSKNLPASAIGPYPAVLKNGRDCKLKPGEDQTMSFSPGSPPPFKKQDWSAAAYEGQQKGMEQILWETGWLDSAKKYTVDGKKDDEGNVIPGTSLKQILADRADFKAELSLLEQLWIDRGHLIISSPKCHPELAGDGIEYAWGFMKKYYRKINSGSEKTMSQKQRSRVFEAMAPPQLPVARLMRYSRTAREYKLVYSGANDGAAHLSHAAIEAERRAKKLAREATSHRGTAHARRMTS